LGLLKLEGCVSLFSHPELVHLIATYGYWIVGAIVALESMGIPMPGETILIAAALYAATTHQLDIGLVIASAAAGAVVGDNIGYWIGREGGYRLLLRYGGQIGITERRIKLGQYLFLRHGGKVVFLGRFVAVLRAFAAFLAGVNRMSWPHFFLANVAGGVVWSTIFGVGAYVFGAAIHSFSKPFAITFAIAAAGAVIVGFIFMRRHEHELENEAERALPGPLRPP
jgi:membrane protein DedA with SNARE-associated domain